MSLYFKPNWAAINKAIAGGQLKELRAEQRQLEKKVQDKVDAHYKEKREHECAEKIAVLKSLPVGGKVYYIGRSSDIKFGAEGTKVKDRRTRMSVDFDGKQWGCYYTNLKIEEITPAEKSSHNISVRLTNLVNGINI